MPYAVVQDIPASWEHYAPLAQAFRDPLPDGLILHVAGPTDEGFRTIEIWETRDAWQRFDADRLGPALPLGVICARPALRELDAFAAIGRLTDHRAGKPFLHEQKEEA
jgi:hypothetical protein